MLCGPVARGVSEPRLFMAHQAVTERGRAWQAEVIDTEAANKGIGDTKGAASHDRE